jgi:hypothetical protein
VRPFSYGIRVPVALVPAAQATPFAWEYIARSTAIGTVDSISTPNFSPSTKQGHGTGLKGPTLNRLAAGTVTVCTIGVVASPGSR